MTRSRFSKPKGTYSQARRLLELYNRLFRKDLIRPREAAELLGVSRRTVERDMAVLREVLGEKLVFEGEPDWVYRLGGQARKWPTTRWQVLSVVLGVKMTGFLSGRQFATDVNPLLSRLRQSILPGQRIKLGRLERKIHVVRGGQKAYHQNPRLQRLLTEMMDALLLERPLDLTYLSPDKAREGLPASVLRIYPLSMVLHRGAVYFIVDVLESNREGGASRLLLTLDRIQEARLDREAEHIPYPRGFSPEHFLATAFGIWPGEGNYTVRVAVDALLRDAVSERFWHETQQVVDLPDGGLEVTLQVGTLREVANWVLGLGVHARVLGPKKLREMVRGELQQALEQYEP